MATQPVPEFTKIKVELQAPVARITLTNPPVNVIDVPLMMELLGAVHQVDEYPGISVLVISGSERAFSAGVDVKAHTPEKVTEMLYKFHSVIRALARSSKISIAAVRGTCMGGGAELALAADFVFAGESSNWAFPEIKLGCFPPVAEVILSALVGPKRAAEMILTGRTIKGAEADRIGMVNACVPDGELEGRVQATVDELVKLSPAALRMAKKAFYGWEAIHLDKGLDRAEKIYLEELMKTHDAQEGIQSFIEKRPPKWTGK